MVTNIALLSMTACQKYTENRSPSSMYDTNYKTQCLKRKRKKSVFDKMFVENAAKSQSSYDVQKIYLVKYSTDSPGRGQEKYKSATQHNTLTKEMGNEELLRRQNNEASTCNQSNINTTELCPVCRRVVDHNSDVHDTTKYICCNMHQGAKSQLKILIYRNKQQQLYQIYQQRNQVYGSRSQQCDKRCTNACFYQNKCSLYSQLNYEQLILYYQQMLERHKYRQIYVNQHLAFHTNGLHLLEKEPGSGYYFQELKKLRRNISGINSFNTTVSLYELKNNSRVYNYTFESEATFLRINKRRSRIEMAIDATDDPVVTNNTVAQYRNKTMCNRTTEYKNYFICETWRNINSSVEDTCTTIRMNRSWHDILMKCINIIQFFAMFLQILMLRGKHCKRNIFKRQEVQPQQHEHQQQKSSSTIRLIKLFLNSSIDSNKQNNSTSQNDNNFTVTRSSRNCKNKSIVISNNLGREYEHHVQHYEHTHYTIHQHHHHHHEKQHQQQKKHQLQYNRTNFENGTSRVLNDLELIDLHNNEQVHLKQIKKKENISVHSFNKYSGKNDENQKKTCKNVGTSVSIEGLAMKTETDQTKQTLRFHKKNSPKLLSSNNFVILISFLLFMVPLTCAQTILSSSETMQSSTISIAQSTSSRQPSKVHLAKKEHVCPSMDIRNSPNNLELLQNCTVIEGFLLFTLINTKGTPLEFNKSFPLLTEVTEYVIVFRVHKLRSLGEIFPNLAIIRGEELFQSTFALVIFSNPDLVEVGLTKLSAINRGGVRLQNNKNLCFAETIDWNEIVSTNAVIKIKNNRPIDDCPKCPGSYILNEDISEPNDKMLSCKESAGVLRCWNSTSCQKICPKECPRNCYDEHSCCNPACLGGCTSNANECVSCRHFSIDNTTCINECPPKLYNYLNRRCITAETCERIGKKFDHNEELHLVAFNKTCSTRCPPFYKLVNKTCEPCGEFCKKKCVGGIIDDVNRARQFEGCTEIIEEGLSISIKIGGSHVSEELRKSLSSIQIIRTYLKVHNTYAMASLSYFENLKVIGGEKLLDDKFALYVLENNDLSEIWGANQSVKIENGTIYFHFNPKLCRDKIMLLTKMMNQSIEVSEIEVSKDSNGSKVSCDNTTLNATVVSIGSFMAEIIVENPYVYPDPRAFIGYQLLFMVDEHKNATKFTYGPCDDKWNVTEPFKTHTVLIYNLKPYTQYAYYVKTKTISSVSKNMESPMGYFTTKSAEPTVVSVTTYAITATNFSIRWRPPRSANGKLVKYTVSLSLDDRPSPDMRNYCKLLDRPDIETPPVMPKDLPPSPDEGKCPAVPDPEKDGTGGRGREKNYIVDDIEIEEFIYFENGIQNFVFLKKKRPGPDYTTFIPNINISNINNTNANPPNLLRKRRNMEANTEYVFLSRHSRDSTENVSSLTNDPIKENSTQSVQNSRYNVTFSTNVSVSTTEFTFENLKPYSRYFVSVRACREREENNILHECSADFQYSVKTLKQENVDIVRNFDAFVEATNSSRGVRLRWEPPEFPNGDVVSYTIEYQLQAQDAASEKKCITQMDFLKMTNGYFLTGLSTGNYKIRVRANTIAGNGIFTAFKYVYIKPIQLSATIIVLIVVCTVILIVGVVACIYMRKKVVAPSDLLIFPTVNPYYVSPPYMPDEWEVPRERIIQLNPLGQGSFGMVYEGLLKGYNNSTEDTLCAIKTTNENATDSERISFLNEASVMKQFDTHHVVRLLGVCSLGQPALVIMELMKNGDLKTYLRAHRPPDQREDIGLPVLTGGAQPPPLSRIYQMAIEIADGMAYLSAKKYVHRDLAARNCMVAADLTVKIGDFGMTRDIYETDYYRKGTKGLLPVRWMPPESLRDGIYSSASDVFSYGVVLWEMATLAAQPYQGFSNDQVLHHVIDGGVMERPDNCPDRLYSLMQKCWLYRPSARPSFMEIIHMLYDMADPKFEQVSFYNSAEGQQILNKELATKSQRSDHIYEDHDNNMDDATTPLHIGDYSGYKSNMANNSSIENQDESPIICDDNLHSPYSTGSVMIVNSASDGQSRNSFSLSHKLYNPNTAGVGVFTGIAPQHSSASNIQHQYKSQQRQYQQSDDNIGTETDDGGYQIYDPSPNFREHDSYAGGDGNVKDVDCDETEEFSLSGLNSKLSGGQNLLPIHKAGKRFPNVMSMSSSMPDEIIRFPSTASGASSNASSTATSTGTTGMRQSLKNVLPSRLLSKSRLFQHKNSGGNSNNKGTGSNNAPAGSGVYSNNGNGSGILSSTNQVLSTIESGGSGSAGSSCITPPNQKSGSSTIDGIGSGSGYKLLDESANISGLSDQLAVNTTNSLLQTITSVPSTGKSIDSIATSTKPLVLTSLTTSSNPNYQLMDKAYEKNDKGSNKQTTLPAIDVSENPNYVMMNEPFSVPKRQLPSMAMTLVPENSMIPIEITNISVNPNYLTMTPNPVQAQSSQHSASSVSDDDGEDDMVEQQRHTGEHIPMICLQQQDPENKESQELEDIANEKSKDFGSNKRTPAPIRNRKQKQRRQPPPNGVIGPDTT